MTRLEIAGVDRQTPVVVPLAAVEQHGDHLPVETDLLINEYLCERLDCVDAEAAVIIPPLAVTCSGHHMDFGGTLTVTHRVMFDYVCEVIDSIVRQGFGKVVLFNSHGGNSALGTTIIESAGLRHPRAHLFMMNWWALAADKLRPLSSGGFGSVGHACEFETSIVAAIGEARGQPGLVRAEYIVSTPLSDVPDFARGDLLRAARAGYHRTMRELTGDGVFGDPSLYSADKGRAIVEVVIGEWRAALAAIRAL